MSPFTHQFRARWVDMDFNQHMRNAAFLGCSEETRMLFMESHGWTMADFQSRQIGPVVLGDKLTCKKELKLLEAFKVDLQIAASTEDLGRIKVRNRFFRESDDALCATVESVVLWFDLKARKPVTPPDQLAAVCSGRRMRSSRVFTQSAATGHPERRRGRGTQARVPFIPSGLAQNRLRSRSPRATSRGGHPSSRTVTPPRGLGRTVRGSIPISINPASEVEGSAASTKALAAGFSHCPARTGLSASTKDPHLL